MKNALLLLCLGLIAFGGLNRAHASPKAMASRLEVMAHNRLSAAEFRRLTELFEAATDSQAYENEEISKISYSDARKTYLVCLSGNISGGVGNAGVGVCSDLKGRFYSMEFGFSGVGLGAGGNIFGGYITSENRGQMLDDSNDNGQYSFKGMAGGASYILGARAICASSSKGRDLCLFGVEAGLGGGLNPDGYITLKEVRFLP